MLSLYSVRNIIFHWLVSTFVHEIDTSMVKIRQLVEALKKQEPKNGELMLNCAQLFSRLAGRNKKVETSRQLLL